jgi:hypothetical protein
MVLFARAPVPDAIPPGSQMKTHTPAVSHRTRLSRTATLALFLFALPCTSCATISNGTTTTISIDSTLTGSRVYVDGVPYETPVELKLSNRTPHVIHGPDWKSYELDPVPAEAAWVGSSYLCIIPPVGLAALLIDAATGSNWTLTPNRINVTSGEATPNPNRRDKQ